MLKKCFNVLTWTRTIVTNIEISCRYSLDHRKWKNRIKADWRSSHQ